MAYLGRNPAIGTQRVLDSLESQFNGSLTTFNLRYNSNTIYPTLASSLIVSLGGVLQEPGTAYDVASDQITFATAPGTGTDCWILLYSEFGAQAAATPTLTVANNAIIGGELHGPANFIIDPAVVGANTGTVEIKGNLTVQGTTTTINSTIVDLDTLSLGDYEKISLGAGGVGDNGGAVESDLEIYSDGTNAYFDSGFIASSASPNIYFRTSSSTTLDTNALTILNNGNIGINDSAPTRKLSINGNMNLASGSRIESYSSGGNLIIQGGSTYPGGHIKMWGGSSDDMITFNTSGVSASSIEKLRIDSSGRIGIGAANNTDYDSNAQNVLIASDGNTGITIRSAGSTPFAMIHFADGTSGQAQQRAGRIMYQHQGDNLTLHTANTERLRISGAGQIGMGKAGVVTVNGNSPLTIQESDSNSETICLRATNSGGNGSQPGLVMKTAAGGHIGGIYCDVNSDYMRLSTSGADRVIITNDGKVCINNDTALSDLHVCTAGSSEQDGTFRIGGNGAGVGLVLDYDQSGQTLSRIMANDTYTNSSALLKISVDADLNANQLVLKGDGNVGIGTDSPGANLDVEGTLLVGTTGVANGTSTINGHLTVDRTGVSGSNPWLTVKSGGSSVFYVNGGGSVFADGGVNATSFTAGTSGTGNGSSSIFGLLTVDRSGIASSNTWFQVKNGTTPIIYANGQGNVGIGTDNPQGKLVVSDGSNGLEFNPNSSNAIVSYNRSTSAYAPNGLQGSTIQLRIGGVGTALHVHSDGNVGIGTATPGYRLEVNGSFAATTKSFVIPHPTKEGMKLRHGSLEGPENGVYARGRSCLEVINLPDYWTALVDPDSITVVLTSIGPSGLPRVERIENNKVYVFSEDSRPLDYFYMINAERVDVEPLEVEIPE